MVTTWAGSKSEWELLKTAVSRDCDDCRQHQPALCHEHLDLLFSDQRLLDLLLGTRRDNQRWVDAEHREN